MQAANKKPSVRIWKVGTTRILGVKNQNLENLPTKVKEAFSFGAFVFADYLVCPLTKDKPGHMQMVCVESMTNIRIEGYREKPKVPVAISTQNKTEQASAIEPLTLLLIAIVAVVLIFLFFSRVTRRIQKPTQSEQKNSARTANKTKAQSDAAVQEKIKYFAKVKVKRIIDGDTVIVVKDWREIRIRLDAIDCPEDGQHWGDTAKYGLIKLIGGRDVRLEEYGQDRYERTLATIFVQHEYESEWINVNERMVTLGHAWVMRMFYDHLPKDRQDKLNRLERWARSKKVGLWQTPDPIPPWKWRKER